MSVSRRFGPEIVATDENNWMACLLTSPVGARCELAYVCGQVFRRSTETECTAWASGNNYGTMRIGMRVRWKVGGWTEVFLRLWR